MAFIKNSAIMALVAFFGLEVSAAPRPQVSFPNLTSNASHANTIRTGSRRRLDLCLSHAKLHHDPCQHPQRDYLCPCHAFGSASLNLDCHNRRRFYHHHIQHHGCPNHHLTYFNINHHLDFVRHATADCPRHHYSLRAKTYLHRRDGIMDPGPVASKLQCYRSHMPF